jgi:hypothetical protein
MEKALLPPAPGNSAAEEAVHSIWVNAEDMAATSTSQYGQFTVW